jgi:hypothetical protein
MMEEQDMRTRVEVRGESVTHPEVEGDSDEDEVN